MDGRESYIDRKELAQMLDVSERTLNRWHRKKMGPERTEIQGQPHYLLWTVDVWITDRYLKLAAKIEAMAKINEMMAGTPTGAFH